MGKRVAGWVLFVAVVVSIVDVVITYVALNDGFGRERNPFAVTVMDEIGVGPTLLAGLVLRVVVVALLALLCTAAGHVLARRAAAAVLTAVTTWWVLIAVNGVVVSARA